MKYLSILCLFAITTLSSQAKSWRVNNNTGVAADFTSFQAASAAATVHDGDTLYMEPSTTDYTSNVTLAKRLIVIGPGYFLDPANTTTPANTGLQAVTTDSRIGFIRFGTSSAGSKFLGVTLNGQVYLNTVNNIVFERVFFPAGIYFEAGTCDAISMRKCFFNGSSVTAASTAVATNFDCENNIFNGGGSITLSILSGTGNIFRNNSMLNSGSFILVNTYVTNNIFGVAADNTLTNCTIKNNIFQANQTLPGTASGNLVNQAMTNVYVGGSTGSLDSRMVLKSGSIAAAFGLTVGAVTSPDAGAFGATDPYKLSGIPNVPSVYSLTVPTSIPSGTATMNITFSTRNNN